MGRVLALILLLVLSIVIVQTGSLRTPGALLDLGSFVFGISLIAGIGFLAFQIGVWGNNTRTLFQARPASLQPGLSAFHQLWNALASFAMSGGVVTTAIVTALEYWGRHDLVMQALDFIVNKMGKIVNALTH